LEKRNALFIFIYLFIYLFIYFRELDPYTVKQNTNTHKHTHTHTHTEDKNGKSNKIRQTVAPLRENFDIRAA